MDDIEKDYEIEISKEAKKELELIKKSATSTVKSKLQRILEDRVVYIVLEEEKTVVISQFLNHYKDK